MKDQIIRTENGSCYQHGHYNKRVYVLHLTSHESDEIIDTLIELALKERYSKILIKVRENRVPLLISKGFIIEAMIPLFENNKHNVFFMSKFYAERELICDEEKFFLDQYPSLIENKKPQLLDRDIICTILDDRYVQDISRLFKDVFDSYPFPVHNPEFIKQTMNENTVYFGVVKNQKLVAVSSCEVDPIGQNAEMTDFAVQAEFRGRRLAYHLLDEMEKEMHQKAIKCLFTIARLREPAMNKTFLNSGYHYSGTLINNTQISGGIQSMNILYKIL